MDVGWEQIGFMWIEMWWYGRQRCGVHVDRNVVV